MCHIRYKASFINHVRSHPICLSCYDPNKVKLMEDLKDDFGYLMYDISDSDSDYSDSDSDN
jgi:hypothetical protein